LASLWLLLKIRQLIDGRVRFAWLDMRVDIHRQIDVAVPHEFLGCFGMDPADGQQASEGMSQCMKIQLA